MLSDSRDFPQSAYQMIRKVMTTSIGVYHIQMTPYCVDYNPKFILHVMSISYMWLI